ncbi:formylglycine-generating enzyme family protein [bacterium]|nr:formylglycine-generating enzyme family protein [bacterium]
MKKIVFILFLSIIASYLFTQDFEITNINVQPQIGYISITYDLDAQVNCQIIILVSDDGGANYNIFPTALIGDIGNNIVPGTGKMISWYPASDPTVGVLETGESYKIRIIARENAVDDDDNFLNFTKVEGGTFYNGTSNITLSDFFIDKYEVTQGEYEAVMGEDPSVDRYGKGNRYPLYSVTWFDAIKYCNLRSLQEGLEPCYVYGSNGSDPKDWPEEWDYFENHINFVCDFSADGYRLPTEMEWMYAAKGGNQTDPNTYNLWSGTNIQADLINYAWYATNSDRKTNPVGTKLANQLNLFDLSGNIIEWCWDIYNENYLNENQTNPCGPSNGDSRVIRGGGWWNSTPQNCQVGYRSLTFPDFSYYDIGFRLVRTQK